MLVMLSVPRYDPPGKKEGVESQRLKRKGVYRLTILVGVVLFVFFAPVVPTSIHRSWLLPWGNQCTGAVLSYRDPQPEPVSVYASISYVGAQLLIDATAGTNHGLFGLIIVPNDTSNSIQFPPLGWENILCL
jgi:hypothetical protein